MSKFLKCTFILSAACWALNAFACQEEDDKQVAKSAGPDRQVTGRVVLDADGSPTSGAEIWLNGPPSRKTVSDGNGEFLFDDVESDAGAVWAKNGKLVSPRQYPRLVRVRSPVGPQRRVPVELRLYEGVVLNVRVKAKRTGKPIVGAVVLPQNDDGYSDDFRTDENGEVSVWPLAPGYRSIEVQAEGFALGRESLQLHREGDTEYEFLLAPGGAIEGMVRDREAQPLAGVQVRAELSDQRSREFGTTTTNADGHYRLAYVPLDAAIELNVSKIGFETQRQRIVVADGGQELEFVLLPVRHQIPVQGIVIDPQGRPIAGALLGGEVTTGPDGRFHIGGHLRGHRGQIHVAAEHFVPQIAQVESNEAEVQTEARIVLKPGHKINGRIIDEAGEPLRDVEVRVDARMRRAGPVQDSAPFAPLPLVLSDEDGGFEFDTLPAECEFSFSKSGFPPMRFQSLTLDANATITVVMQPPGVFFGQVVDAITGRPVRKFHVRCRKNAAGVGLPVNLSDSGEEFRTTDGAFEIGDGALTIGMPLELIVDAEGYQRLVVDSKAQRREEAEAVWFRLTPEDPANLLTYAGRLTDVAGAAAAGVEVRLIATTAVPLPGHGALNPTWALIRMDRRLASYASVVRFGVATTDHEGRFDFVRIPRDANVELAWWRPGIAPSRRRQLERLSDVERSALEIRVDAAASIVGPIDRKTFPQARSVLVRSERPDGEGTSQELSDEQEIFEIADLAPGVYEVELLGPVEQTPASPQARFPNGFGGRFPPNQRFPKKLAEAKVTVKPGDVYRVEFKK